MATAAECHKLTDFYKKIYKAKYGVGPKINQYSARWGFDAMLRDMPATEIKNLLEYYLLTSSPNSHSLDWLFYNYEKVREAHEVAVEDAKRRVELRAASKKRAEEWSKRIEQSGI